MICPNCGNSTSDKSICEHCQEPIDFIHFFDYIPSKSPLKSEIDSSSDVVVNGDIAKYAEEIATLKKEIKDATQESKHLKAILIRRTKAMIIAIAVALLLFAIIIAIIFTGIQEKQDYNSSAEVSSEASITETIQDTAKAQENVIIKETPSIDAKEKTYDQTTEKKTDPNPADTENKL